MVHAMKDATTAVRRSEMVADAARGLAAGRKRLSPKWLYDAAGSALFERITGLPEYYLTRTETAILRSRAAALARLPAWFRTTARWSNWDRGRA